MPTKVLIVDDAMFMRAILKDVLLNAGDFEVVGEATDGEEAVKFAKELSPDLITMDIVMPNMDGIEATKQIMKVTPSVKIVMCSALGQEPLIMESLASGAKDFVVKPFSAEKVLKVIQGVLSK
ncbi:MAG: response regulator [Acidobacteriota bacterium]|nr:MAG: response regulator [Acidobacteriota bacterium]